MKKRNPQDATLRNIRALKTRVASLEKRLRPLERWIIGVVKRKGAAVLLCLSIAGGVGVAQIGCAPKNLSQSAQVAYTADQIVKRLGEVQNAVIAACQAGTGPTCAAGAPMTTETSRALVQAILTATAGLKASPQGWQATVQASWASAKLTPPLLTPGAKGYVLAIDALLGVS